MSNIRVCGRVVRFAGASSILRTNGVSHRDQLLLFSLVDKATSETDWVCWWGRAGCLLPPAPAPPAAPTPNRRCRCLLTTVSGRRGAGVGSCRKRRRRTCDCSVWTRQTMLCTCPRNGVVARSCRTWLLLCTGSARRPAHARPTSLPSTTPRPEHCHGYALPRPPALYRLHLPRFRPTPRPRLGSVDAPASPCLGRSDWPQR